MRGRTRPRYLIRSARVQALFSCWARATAFCAARASSSSVSTAPSAPCVRGPAWPLWPCQTDGATDASGTPRVRASLSAQPACSCATSSAPSFFARVLKFEACARCASSRWDGARPYRCSNRAARTRRSAVMDSRREENTRIIAPEMPLISKPCPSSRAVHSRPNRAVRASSRCWETIAATAPMCSLYPRESGARHFPSVPVLAVWAIWEWTCSCMSPSREVCCSQCATARSAWCHWPVSRPCTRVPWEPVRV